jgi:hypothetical protein
MREDTATITITNESGFPDQGQAVVYNISGEPEYIEYEKVYRKPTLWEFISGLLHFRFIRKVATTTLNAKKTTFAEGERHE